MKENYYRIADLNIKMNTFGRTLTQAKIYKSEEVKNIDFEIVQYTELIRQHYPQISEDETEYMASGLAFYTQLLDFDGFMLHSSAVVVDNRAYLFSADSGTGKSTHTQLWLKLFGDRAYILNDDKPALRLIDGVWYAYGTPWSGKCDTSVNRRVPVAGIAMLERSEENEISPFSGSEALRSVLAQVNRSRSMERIVKLLDLLDKLFNMVPIWKLKCNMDESAAILSYETMTGEKYAGK